MLKSMAVSVIGGVLLRLFMPQQFPPFMSQKPSFIEQHIPAGHYLGISTECSQLADAKDDSIQNAIKQILQQIGAEYQLEFEKMTYSDDNEMDVIIKDSLSYTSAGILGDSELKNSYYEKTKSKYIYYTLVYFPQSKIIRARLLIEQENSKRLAQYESFIKEGRHAESEGNIIDALNYYWMAVKQVEGLFKERKTKKALAEGYLKNLSSRIGLRIVSNYNQRNRHYVSCRVLYNNKPAPDIPLRFQLSQGKGSIPPLVYSDSNGIAQCDAEMKTGTSSNIINAWIDIDRVDSAVDFNFSTFVPKPVVSTSPLEIINNCFAFEVRESNDVDVAFDKYEIHIDAKYKNASFINYYIAHVDSSKNRSRAFNLLNPINVKGANSRAVTLPFNSWVRERIDELDKWYLGSRLEYRIVLIGDGLSVSVQ